MKSQKKPMRPAVRKTSLTKGGGVPPVPGAAADHIDLPDGTKAGALVAPCASASCLFQYSARLHSLPQPVPVGNARPDTERLPRFQWACRRAWTPQWRRRSSIT